MPKRQNLTKLPERILATLSTRGRASTGELARSTGVTRQAVQYHLKRLLAEGRIERIGAGRATGYARTSTFSRRWPMGSAAEDDVWRELRDETPCLQEATEEARSILAYAVTEMVNNAIDHSAGTAFEVIAECREASIGIEVVDDGVGAFNHLRDRLALPDAFAAIQQLSKGKETTDPEHHSGEGIFFTSKAVDRFELESAGLRWIVDNRKDDQAVGDSERTTGTRVRLELPPDTRRRLGDVFSRYTSEGSFAFDTSRATVRLFEIGTSFVSRSEAKRLATGLERFEHVLVDFRGVRDVGQGFVDELFRVWRGDHPGTTLEPVNMSPAVEQMVRRGLTPER